MRTDNEARTIGGGIVDVAHTIIQVCEACGYDLDEAELAADTCADCGTTLNLKQTVQIQVTSVPVTGSTL